MYEGFKLTMGLPGVPEMEERMLGAGRVLEIYTRISTYRRPTLLRI